MGAVDGRWDDCGVEFVDNDGLFELKALWGPQIGGRG